MQDRYSVPEATVDGLDDGDVLVAGAAFDALAPFTPEVAMSLDEDPTGATLPDALKDWLALKALALAVDEPGPITSEGMGRSSTTYASPEHTQSGKRLLSLIAPYLKRTGARA